MGKKRRDAAAKPACPPASKAEDSTRKERLNTHVCHVISARLLHVGFGHGPGSTLHRAASNLIAIRSEMRVQFGELVQPAQKLVRRPPTRVQSTWQGTIELFPAKIQPKSHTVAEYAAFESASPTSYHSADRAGRRVGLIARSTQPNVQAAERLSDALAQAVPDGRWAESDRPGPYTARSGDRELLDAFCL
jgi:hypothetical protein